MKKTISPDRSGISLRTLYVCIIILAVIISVMMVLSTYHLSTAFTTLSGATDEYIELEKAAYELMDASDYLTEKVQRFTADGDLTYMEEYFTEADRNKRRENAIKKMAEDPRCAEALVQLEEAMRYSLDLMEQEYYAMRLVIEAKGYDDCPSALDSVELLADDAALSPEDKMRRATALVLGDSYYEVKDMIRENMKDSLDTIEALTREVEDSSAEGLSKELRIFRFVIVLQLTGVFMMVFLTSHLGISPILKAVERIKKNDRIPVVGANEFRYLARTYNKMYSVYKKSVDRLNYKASHDELTGLYNRAGYDLVLSTLDLSTTYLIIFDLDNFKEINDTEGHSMGDKALKKVAEILRSNFRSDDYLCRIGGDEFVVFMVHNDTTREKLIRSKIAQINSELLDTSDGVAATTVSAGICHGSYANSAADLFDKADKALYITKRRGKNGCYFYEP